MEDYKSLVRTDPDGRPKSPESLEELCDYILDYYPGIYVREKVSICDNGHKICGEVSVCGQCGRVMRTKYDSISMGKMPTKYALFYALSFIKDGRIPAILLPKVLPELFDEDLEIITKKTEAISTKESSDDH